MSNNNIHAMSSYQKYQINCTLKIRTKRRTYLCLEDTEAAIEVPIRPLVGCSSRPKKY